ncbi:putative dimethylaniline monooxygenase [Podospora conica]|nr:putative dimethylaniline monooxygenase [Schizothecium conicum]
MCHRDGFFVAPKVVPEPVILGVFGRPRPGRRPNKPIDMTVASLFDTAYVPPVLQRSNLLWDAYNAWIKGMFASISGTSSGLDQWVGGVSSGRRHIDSYFVVKTTKAMPYISAPYRSQAGIWNSIRSALINIPLPDTGGREIELAPWPRRVSKLGDRDVLEFRDNKSPESSRLKLKTAEAGPVTPDVVIIATGYRREFPFLSDEYPRLPDCKVRGIYADIEDGLAYIGFVRPSIGAIPPLAELQAQLWVSRLVEHHLSKKSSGEEGDVAPRPLKLKRKNRAAVEPYELDYALHPRGGYDFFAQKLGVDHEALAYQLALDMGSAPKATHVLRKHGWKVFFTWAFGPNINPKFRLLGPWASPEQAAEIMRTELFDVVKRTGGGVFFVTYTVVPQVVFGFLSMVLMLGRWVVRAIGAVIEAAHTQASSTGQFLG